MDSAIGFLAGVWRVAGAGEFPTMASFAYEEEIRFIDSGFRRSCTSSGPGHRMGELLHLETGIWRASPEGELAVSVALPRVTEISEGRIADGTISLVATSVRRAEGGAGLVAVERTYRCETDALRYRIAMATEEVGEVTHHLAGTLRRVSPAPR